MKTISENYVAICVLTLPLCTASAENLYTPNFKEATTYIKYACDEEMIYEAGIKYNESLPDYDKKVTGYALKACKSIFSKEKETDIDKYWDFNMRTEILGTVINQFTDLFELSSSDTYFPVFKSQLSEWQALTDLQTDPNSQFGIPLLPYVDSKLVGPVDLQYRLLNTKGNPNQIAFSLNSQQNQHCVSKVNDADDCIMVFNELEIVTKKLSVFQRYHTSKEFEAYTALKKEEWDKFSDNSRFMTFVDVAFTSWVYRKRLSLSNDLNSPPPYQLFAFRPSFIYEHLNDAPNGAKDELGIAVEWVGFNAWDWKVPIGVSLTTVYADRASVKSVGHGLMFHFNNDFSIGWANRGDGDNSFYVNFEFKDWFGDKQDLQKLF